MKAIHTQALFFLLALVLCTPAMRVQAQAAPTAPPPTLAAAVQHVLSVVSPEAGAEARTFSTTLKVVKAEGLPKELVGKEARIAYQAPDRFFLEVEVKGDTLSAGSDGVKLWMRSAKKKFALVGSPDVPRFRTDTGKVDGTKLPPIKVPVAREQMMLMPLLCTVETKADEVVQGEACSVLTLVPRPEAQKSMKLPDVAVTFWVRKGDAVPLRFGVADGKGKEVVVELVNPDLEPAWADSQWKLPAADDDRVETVALSHLTRFIPAALSSLGQKIPTLGPVTGERRVVARHGKGRLEVRDGTQVLFLKGTPEEIGEQHGTIMKKEVRFLVDRILYGVGVGSSFAKGTWFFGEIESAQARLQPFVSEAHLREMDALAAASGVRVEEARLANFFPELFHCSGFAIYGDATAGGRMYHGRVLDYMKGVGLEQNACVIVMQPEGAHAWVNLGYAGFLGTVTAMNEKQIAIGEMGGKGEGNWDGKPMAQLMREVMEQADTLDEAVEIMRRGPRTCEYYYVISDGKTKRAVGIAATPTTFETIWAGDTHPKLPHAMKDTVLMSAGDRYEALTERVKQGYGKFEMETARDLMTRPVCMTSNIQSVLFAPETLDFWVANADGENVASHTRYTHYNLKELLQPEGVAGE
ncbi:C45 family autoproteolytic acyltransferase/hydolase [Roseimicrobium gellanilyticum]|nr:C45 family peptidase [Roseimicrobium gellanilyticum]